MALHLTYGNGLTPLKYNSAAPQENTSAEARMQEMQSAYDAYEKTESYYNEAVQDYQTAESNYNSRIAKLQDAYNSNNPDAVARADAELRNAAVMYNNAVDTLKQRQTAYNSMLNQIADAGLISGDEARYYQQSSSVDKVDLGSVDTLSQSAFQSASLRFNYTARADEAQKAADAYNELAAQYNAATTAEERAQLEGKLSDAIDAYNEAATQYNIAWQKGVQAGELSGGSKLDYLSAPVKPLPDADITATSATAAEAERKRWDPVATFQQWGENIKSGIGYAAASGIKAITTGPSGKRDFNDLNGFEKFGVNALGGVLLTQALGEKASKSADDLIAGVNDLVQSAIPEAPKVPSEAILKSYLLPGPAGIVAPGILLGHNELQDIRENAVGELATIGTSFLGGAVLGGGLKVASNVAPKAAAALATSGSAGKAAAKLGSKLASPIAQKGISKVETVSTDLFGEAVGKTTGGILRTAATPVYAPLNALTVGYAADTLGVITAPDKDGNNPDASTILERVVDVTKSEILPFAVGAGWANKMLNGVPTSGYSKGAKQTAPSKSESPKELFDSLTADDVLILENRRQNGMPEADDLNALINRRSMIDSWNKVETLRAENAAKNGKFTVVNPAEVSDIATQTIFDYQTGKLTKADNEFLGNRRQNGMPEADDLNALISRRSMLDSWNKVETLRAENAAKNGKFTVVNPTEVSDIAAQTIFDYQTGKLTKADNDFLGNRRQNGMPEADDLNALINRRSMIDSWNKVETIRSGKESSRTAAGPRGTSDIWGDGIIFPEASIFSKTLTEIQTGKLSKADKDFLENRRQNGMPEADDVEALISRRSIIDSWNKVETVRAENAVKKKTSIISPAEFSVSDALMPDIFGEKKINKHTSADTKYSEIDVGGQTVLVKNKSASKDTQDTSLSVDVFDSPILEAEFTIKGIFGNKANAHKNTPSVFAAVTGSLFGGSIFEDSYSSNDRYSSSPKSPIFSGAFDKSIFGSSSSFSQKKSALETIDTNFDITRESVFDDILSDELLESTEPEGRNYRKTKALSLSDDFLEERPRKSKKKKSKYFDFEEILLI